MSESLRDAWYALDKDCVLVHGAARGADKTAAKIWTSRGLVDEPHPANWKQFGRAAGHIRNEEMVALGADLMLAFLVADAAPGEPPRNVGTRNCIKQARDAGIEVIEVWEL